MASTPTGNPPGAKRSARAQQRACQSAEHGPIDQRSFVASGDQAQSFLDLLDRPTEDSAALHDLFSRPEPWGTP
jgi:uncharacterized protein (DUF1778 family)